MATDRKETKASSYRYPTDCREFRVRTAIEMTSTPHVA
jgi:hypothetical protein